MKLLTAALLALLLTQTMATAAQTEHRLTETVENTIDLRYLLFTPKEYAADSEKKWPLMLFLHGAGERGDDLAKVKTHGPPMLVESNPDFPFILVSPQCPTGKYWNSESLNALLDKIVEEYPVDEARIYVTGLSMGGFGTWQLAFDYPDRFAAIAPICGGGEAFKARTIANLPIWAFHGADDTVVPVQRTEEMIEALRKLGSKVLYTRYENTGHNSWTQTYANPELYEWFLKQKKPASSK